jgi:3-dehydroquinate dehydratase-2
VQILVLNGVNLDVLGRRDPVLYGGLSIDELETRIYHWANEAGHTARCRQTNSEGEYIDWIHDAIDWQGGIIVNAAAWTHYSYAIRDALEILTCPWVEVHLSNVDDREDWRRISVIDGLASHRIVGKGPQGYKEAIEWLSANANG